MKKIHKAGNTFPFAAYYEVYKDFGGNYSEWFSSNKLWMRRRMWRFQQRRLQQLQYYHLDNSSLLPVRQRQRNISFQCLRLRQWWWLRLRRRMRQQQLYMVDSYSSFLRRWMRLLKGCRRKGQGCYFPALSFIVGFFRHLFFIILTANTIAIIIMTIPGQSKPPIPNLSSPLWHIFFIYAYILSITHPTT